MRPTPRVLRVYTLVTAAAALLSTLALAIGMGVGSAPIWRVAVLAAAAIAANRFPLHLTDKTKVFVDAAVFTAAIIVLDPATAAAVAAVALIVDGLVTRPIWEQAVFNAAQTCLYVGTGAATMRAATAAGRFAMPHLPAQALGVMAGVTVMHALNTMLVAGIVALQLDRDAVATWIDGVLIDLPEHVALTATGVLAAALLVSVPWLAPLLVAPTAVAYCSLCTALELRAATKELADAASRVAMLLDGSEPGLAPQSDHRLRVRPARFGDPRLAADAASHG